MARGADLQIVLLTPPGRGAIAAIRLQGAGALAAVEKCFRPQSGPPPAARPLDCLIVGRFGPEPGEEVVVRRLPGAAVEICSHGGHAAVARIVDLLAAGDGCVTAWQEWRRRQADDPIRAAAAIALADAPTLRTAAILLDQYHGALRRAVGQVQAALHARDLATAGRLVADLLSRADIGLHLTRPWRVVLGGGPNVGKSTLLNALVGYGRAIIHSQPGTTRDVVTATTAVDGWPVEVADTAGLRAATDPLEQAGIALAVAQLAAADLAILVFDARAPWTPDLDRLALRWPSALLVFNKSDLVAVPERGEIVGWAERSESHRRNAPKRWWDSLRSAHPTYYVSALQGDGIQELLAAIAKRLIPQPPAQGAAVPFTSSQIAHLTETSIAIAHDDVDAAEVSLAGL